MALEKFKQDEKTTVEEQFAGYKPQESNLAGILQDPKRSQLFGDMLYASGDPADRELAQRVMKGELSSGDMETASLRKKEFDTRMESARAILQEVNETSISKYAKNSKELQSVIDLVGGQKAARAISSQLEALAMKDIGSFQILQNQLLTQKENQQKFEEEDKKIEELAEKYGITADDYVEALSIKDTAKREKALAELVAEKYGRMKSLRDWINGGKYSSEAAKELSSRKAEAEKAIQELSLGIDTAGSFLASIVDSSEDIRKAIGTELKGDRALPPPEQVSFLDIKKALPSEKDFDEEWESVRESITDWSTFTSEQKKAKFDEFAAGRKEKMKKQFGKKAGFWSLVADATLDCMNIYKRDKLI